jgi:23S rRNA (cytidine1920-2'-O)/16S rRNA (cytidine1409-2'-O)-methyltransferase
MTDKKRLDQLVTEKGLARSREEAQRLIRAGKILVNEERIEKPGHTVDNESNIRSLEPSSLFVSRGGEKLASALKELNLNVEGWEVADFGASTGGFTDCLLQNGAQKVYAFDVGYGQIHEKLRKNPRVEIHDRTNVRYLEIDICKEQVNLVTIDVSFISLKLVLPAAEKICRKNGYILALIKPQFEIGKNRIGKGGVVRNRIDHEEVLRDMVDWVKESSSLSLQGLASSPITGPKGNREYFMLLLKSLHKNIGTDPELERSIINKVVEKAWSK